MLQIRKLANLYGFLLCKDGIDWEVLSAIRLTERETTSASRIFTKILFQKIAENMGIEALRKRMCSEEFQHSFSGIVGHEEAEDVRFVINFFTQSGLKPLTESLRESLQVMEERAVGPEELKKFKFN